MLGKALSLAAAGSAGGEYQIERSLRFNSADSAYLSRTPASAGNSKTWTFSVWVKRSLLSTFYITTRQGIFVCATSGSVYWGIEFNSSEQLTIYDSNAGGSTSIVTDQVFRDFSAWYHIVVAVDTTQATASDRVKLYVNGDQITSFGAANYPPQNSDTLVNSANSHSIGSWTPAGAYYMNGYFADLHLIDGQALTASSFGEINATTGVWSPIAYAGTYGTNGFHLNFSDNSNTTAATLGADSSGNGNNWTPNNFSVTAGAGNDCLVDTPTPYGTDTGAGGEVRGNYCTWNTVAPSTVYNGSVIFSNGALTTVDTASPVTYGVHAVGTFPMSSGKWYWEIEVASSGGLYAAIGLIRTDYPLGSGQYGYVYWNQAFYRSGVNAFAGISAVSYGATYTTGDVIGVALDLDAGTLVFYKNGVSQGTAESGLSGTFLAAVGDGQNSTVYQYNANFGQRPFAYTAPSGFKALCTTNLPDPTVLQGDQYFNTMLWSGNSINPRSITGVGFQPDFSWIKTRNNGSWSHCLFDVQRGNSVLHTNLTNAETASHPYGYLSSFDSDGFTVSAGTIGDQQVNNSLITYVGWNWKAGGAGSSNTDGTITSTVSANQNSGFSIVTYSIASASSTISTFGHGLGVAPSMVILKVRNAADEWTVYHKSIPSPNDNWLILNTTAAAGGSTATFSSSSTTFGVRETRLVASSGSGNILAYCFAEIPGYSAFGKYVGTGITNGPYIYTGFRPRWIMFKRYDSTNGWFILDTARNIYNDLTNYISADGAAAEASVVDIADYLSNGFKIRGGSTYYGFNASGGQYIYAAFAENPFKYALAR